MTASTDLLWAKSKPYKNLLEHMIDTGLCAQYLLQYGCAHSCLKQLISLSGLTEIEILHLVSYLAALHDIGKCHPEFQCKAPELKQVLELRETGKLKTSGSITPFRHELYTREVLERVWKECHLVTKDYSEMLSCVLSMHHQGKSGRNARLLPSCKDFWHDMQSEIELQIRSLFNPRIPLLEHCLHSDAFAMIIMGIVILSDWIASGPHFESLHIESTMLYTASSKNAARIALADYGLLYCKPLPSYDDFCLMWPEIARSGIRPLQSTVESLSPLNSSLCLIEAPMGEGKTEAALYLAAQMVKYYDKKGIYVALPTAATSNQMHDRVNALFKTHNIASSRLLHSTAWLLDDYTKQKSIQSEDASSMAQWLAPLRRGLLSPNAVGTVDQAMTAVLQVKYGVLRLLGLTGKVLVIDEVHAYDAYMNTIIERLLEWCHALDIPVILLSATLTQAKRAQLLQAYGASIPSQLSEAYPLYTCVDNYGTTTEIPVGSTYMNCIYQFQLYPFLGDYQKTAQMAINISSNGGCLCVMLNTVNAAQVVYLILKDLVTPDTELSLFHARFTARRRQEIENECVRRFGKNAKEERPKKAILVCTQVVEQSLDVDFDYMITELAPIDLLLQRAGREHRHEQTKRPIGCETPIINVLVSNDTKYGATSAIYNDLLLNRTKYYLKEHSKIAVPAQMRDAINTVYSDIFNEEESEASARLVFSEQIQQGQAQGVILTSPNEDYFFGVEMDPQELFCQEDKESMFTQSAKTRIGSETTRIAILEPKTLQQAKQDCHNINMAREVLLQSVSIQSTSFGEPPATAWNGEGLLCGCLLLPTEPDGSAIWGKYRIRNSDEFGTTY